MIRPLPIVARDAGILEEADPQHDIIPGNEVVLQGVFALAEETFLLNCLDQETDTTPEEEIALAVDRIGEMQSARLETGKRL